MAKIKIDKTCIGEAINMVEEKDSFYFQVEGFNASDISKEQELYFKVEGHNGYIPFQVILQTTFQTPGSYLSFSKNDLTSDLGGDKLYKHIVSLIKLKK